MTQKAERATITLGEIELNVFLLEDGAYRLSSTGIANILGLSSHYRVAEILTSKSVKPKTAKALGLLNDQNFKLKFDKVSTTDAGNINALSVDLFNLVVSYEAFNGNEKAQSILEACLAEAIERRADKAFDKHRCEEEYNARVIARGQGVQARWELTDSIQAYIQRNNITGNKAKFMYKHATDRLYKNLTGYNTSKLRQEYDIPVKATPRDYGSERDLRHVKEIEAAAQRYIDTQNMNPVDAIDKVSGDLLLKNVGWNRQSRIK